MWFDPIENPPESNTDVLVYTENGTMRVAKKCNNIWNTYLKILGWQPLPKDKPTIKEKKK